jgi:hypothetical protein
MEAPAMMTSEQQAELLEKVVVGGDLSKLSPAQRVQYYQAVCQSLGVNPLTRPFDYLVLNGRLTLYANRTCADQLRTNRNISVKITAREVLDDVYIVTAWGRLPDGREDEATGAVSIAGLKGEARANAMMKAETKAKRRLTLSLAGLGWMDETEVDTVPNARRVRVDYDTGEIVDHPAMPEATPAPPKVQHPLEAAGLARTTIATLARWIGEGRPAAQWSPDQRAASQEVAEALLALLGHGAPAADIEALVQDYAHREGDRRAAVQDLLAAARTWLASLDDLGEADA